ncbi:MAG: H-type lectin domain-containing protein [Agarilytica sp.]
MGLLRFIIITVSLASFSQLAAAIDMKVDRVTINTPASGGTVTWASVTFQQAFGATPVVVVTPTDSNPQPATVRIRNVTTTGFEVGVVEPSGSDGQTTEMTLDYFAAETGTYTFPGAIRMVVGSYSTTTHQGRNMSGAGWDDVNFPTTFGAVPAVVTQVQTINSQPTLAAGDLGVPFLEVAVRNVTTVDMDAALELAETSTGTVVAETIGYIAMESGDSFTLSGSEVQAYVTPDNVQGWSNNCRSNNFPSSFSGTPLVVASQNSRDGGDGGWARRCALSGSSIGLQIDEDQANDSERAHTTEEVGVFAIEAAFHGTRNGRDIEAGSVTIPGTAEPTAWTTVTFPETFSEAPLIFALPTDEGTTPAALRVRNVSTTSFDIAAFQPTGGSGAHPQMEVDYVAIIPGEHTLPNGDIFEAGTIQTNAYQAGTGGSTGTATINFSAAFSGGAAALLTIQSINNEPALDPNSVSVPWLVTTTRSLGSGSMTVALERAEAIAGSVSLVESIAYFAVQDGANDSLDATDGSTIDYEMFVTPDNIQGWDNGCYNNSFSDTYASPYAIATQSSRDGANGGWVRRCNLESARIGLTIDEDQANDSERSHITEEASVFVFSQAFEASFNTIDHYTIFHSGNGITCEAESVTIGAHDAADLGVEAGGRTITITATSSTPGWLASDATWALTTGTGSFSTPSIGVAQYTFDTGESSVELLLANTSEADIDIDVVDTDPGLSDQDGAAEDPLLSFTDTALRFYNDANGDGNADGTDPIQNPQVSGTTNNQLILRAIETNTITGACEARVGSQTLSVNMAYECLDPGTCQNNQDMNINAIAIEENDSGSVADFSALNLSFDADGEAPLTMQYLDAGRVRLHAQLALSASGGEPALTLIGTSDDTIVRPADLVITRVEDPSGNNNPSTTTSGSGFVASDSAFTVEVQAHNALGAVTPNFGLESVPEGIILRATSLVMPSAGDLPALTAADSFVAGASLGIFENTLVRWPEAGSILMRAEIDDGDYMGTGLNTLGTESGTIGRFFPDHLLLSSGTVTDGCAGNFSYMSDQTFSYTPANLNLTIRAMTASLSVLDNYDGNYPTATFALDAENANDGNNLASRLNAANPGGTWANGEYLIGGTENLGFARDLSGADEVPDGPFDALQIGLRTSGSNPDNANFQDAALNYDAGSTGDCSATSSCSAISLGNLDIRFGRIYTASVHGPESADLAMPFEIQYWNPPEGFVRNTEDNCSILDISAISFNSGSLSADANRTATVGSGTSTGSFLAFTPGLSLSFIGGDAGLVFTAPGVGNTGEFNVDVNLGLIPWLRSDWDNNGDSANDSAVPSAAVSFGRYRGHDRVIYWQEVLN